MTLLTIGNRPSTYILENIGYQLWSFKPNLMKEIVNQHGGLKALKWFGSNMPKYEKILKEMGPITTHLLAVEISAINGCPYCTFGHAYAFQLHFFKDYKTLFHIDEYEMMSYCQLNTKATITRIRQMLNNGKLFDQLPYFEKMLEMLNHNTNPMAKEEQYIQHLIQMFGYLNTCGIEGKTPHDEAHDPINKNEDLKKVYSLSRGINTINSLC